MNPLSTTTTTGSSVMMNFLMCSSIADLFHIARRLALLRSAGSMGGNLFEGARSRGLVPMYVDTSIAPTTSTTSMMTTTTTTPSVLVTTSASRSHASGGGQEVEPVSLTLFQRFTQTLGISSAASSSPQQHNPQEHYPPNPQLTGNNNNDAEPLSPEAEAVVDPTTTTTTHASSSSSSLSQQQQQQHNPQLLLINVHHHQYAPIKDVGFQCQSIIDSLYISIYSLEETGHPYMTGYIFGRRVAVRNMIITHYLSLKTAMTAIRAIGPKSVEFGENMYNADGLPPKFLENSTFLLQFNFPTTWSDTFCKIHEGFLSGCTRLQELDLQQLPQDRVTSVGWWFLKDCQQLTQLNLARLSLLSTLPSGFLQGCVGLQTLDLTPLSHLKTIESSCFRGCISLRSLDLPPPLLVNVTSVGPHFMSGCMKLRSLDLSALRGVTEIQESFLEQCSSLEELDLTPLSNVVTIQPSFLAHCSSLQRINLAPFANAVVEQESDFGYFMWGCSSLTEVDFNPLETSFLANPTAPLIIKGCAGLKVVRLREDLRQYIRIFSTTPPKMVEWLK